MMTMMMMMRAEDAHKRLILDNMMIGKLLDLSWWAVTFGAARRGAPASWTKSNQLTGREHDFGNFRPSEQHANDCV